MNSNYNINSAFYQSDAAAEKQQLTAPQLELINASGKLAVDAAIQRLAEKHLKVADYQEFQFEARKNKFTFQILDSTGQIIHTHILIKTNGQWTSSQGNVITASEQHAITYDVLQVIINIQAATRQVFHNLAEPEDEEESLECHHHCCCCHGDSSADSAELQSYLEQIQAELDSLKTAHLEPSFMAEPPSAPAMSAPLSHPQAPQPTRAPRQSNPAETVHSATHTLIEINRRLDEAIAYASNHSNIPLTNPNMFRVNFDIHKTMLTYNEDHVLATPQDGSTAHAAFGIFFPKLTISKASQQTPSTAFSIPTSQPFIIVQIRTYSNQIAQDPYWSALHEAYTIYQAGIKAPDKKAWILRSGSAVLQLLSECQQRSTQGSPELIDQFLAHDRLALFHKVKAIRAVLQNTPNEELKPLSRELQILDMRLGRLIDTVAVHQPVQPYGLPKFIKTAVSQSHL